MSRRAWSVGAVFGLWFAGAAAATTGGPYVPPTCPTFVYHSVPALGAQRLCMNVGVRTRATAPGTYLFLTPGGVSGDGVGIFTDTGTLVWWHRMGAPRDHDASVVRYHGRSYLAVFSGHPAAVGPYDTGSVTLYNQHYQEAGKITAGRPFGPDSVDLHEFRLTPQGNALIGITDPVRRRLRGRAVTVIQYVIQELSLVRDAHGIHTGRVLFQWRSLRHVPVSESYLPRPGFGTPWDYFHGNSIAQDTDGNLIVSARNTWAVYKINVTTGKVMWQLGGKGDHMLRAPWCYQHDAVPLGHDEYSVFDDAGAGPRCEPGPGQHPARGILFRAEPSTHPAKLRLVRTYTHHPPINPLVAGSVQRLADGDVLIDWGNVPEITEYSADGRAKMDLSLSHWSYRGLRFAWHGEPLTRPAVSAQLASTQTDMWASWNGSTEVAAWQALAGSSPSTLRAIGAPAVKHSFETPITLDRRYHTVRVEALDARGHVLAASRTVATS